MKPSRNIAIHTENPEKTKTLYQSILALQADAEYPHGLAFGNNAIFIEEPYVDDNGEKIFGPIFELLVDDVEIARDEMIANGCKVVLWEGEGKCCYIEDPSGIRFNLYPAKLRS